MEREEKVVSADKYCHECGAELPESGDFCPQCGARRVPTKIPRKATATASGEVQKKEIAVPGAGIAGLIFGMISLIFVFMPFYVVTVGTTYPIAYSMSYSMSGFDLARGVMSLLGLTFSGGPSYPIIWLVVLGGVLALLFGLLGIMVSVSASGSSGSNIKLLWALMAISGIMIMIGSIIATIQILGVSTSYSTSTPITGYGTVTITVSSFPGFGVFGEVAIGAIIMTLGAIAASRNPKGH